MPHVDFVHLRVHSAYSLSEGAIKCKQLAELARRNDMPAVAVTDTGNLFGVMEFAAYAKDAGLQPIVGCLLGITRPDQETHAIKQAPPGWKSETAEFLARAMSQPQRTPNAPGDR